MMRFKSDKPSLREHIYWFFHRHYTLLEIDHEGKQTTTYIYRRRLAIRIARRSKAIHWMLYRRNAWGYMGRLIAESHNFPEPTAND